MAEFVPDITTYGKVAEKIEEMRSRLLSSTSINSYVDILEEIEQTISLIINDGNLPMAEYEDFFRGEPPDKDKMNEIFHRLEADFALMEAQADVTKAAAVFQYNQLALLVKKNDYLNSQARDRIGVMQLYTNSSDSNVINFGSNLTNDSEFDFSLSQLDDRPSLIAPGNLTLSAKNIDLELAGSADAKILDGSNGVPGNNQELEKIVQEIPPGSVGDSDEAGDEDLITDYIFKQDMVEAKFLEHGIDNEPNTWFEFEIYKLSDNDKATAEQYNLKYGPPVKNTQRKYRDSVVDSYSYLGENNIRWANGPLDGSGILKLNLEYDLQSVKKVNTIALTNFGLEENRNEPFNIKKVQVSADRSEWITLKPEEVWIASDASKAIARLAPNTSVASAVWVFPELDAQYVRFYIEQPYSIGIDVGHVYYETKGSVTEEINEIPDPNNPGGTIIKKTQKTTPGVRVEGPYPPVDNTAKYNGPIGALHSNSIIRKMEKFSGKRWAIGIRDISIKKTEFAEKSSLFTKTYMIDGMIDRVSLEAEYEIPNDFSDDEQWVRFFISPNKGVDWFQISRIQDDYLGIPEIITFNDPIPHEYRDPNVQYVDVDNTVESIKLKIELSRPPELNGQSPIIKNYNLKVQKR